MLGASVPLIIILALATAVVLSLVVAFWSMPGVTRAVTRSFWCPWRSQGVTAEFQEEVWDGKRVEVTRCSAFSPSTDLGCDKPCLEMKKLPSSGKQSIAA